MMKVMIVTLLGALMLSGVLAATCTGGNELQCASSLCPNYAYGNNTCSLQTGRTCVTGQVFSNSACTTCSSLTQSTCTTTCPDHLWTTSGGSTTCHACYSLYGAECIKCTTSICTACSFTSGTVLSSDSLSCVTSTCSAVPNCIECYSGGTKCYRCSTGYIVDNNFNCSVANCNVANCITCSGTVCGNCFPGYSLSSNGLDCAPICSDIYCTTCIGPQVCGTCIAAYTPDVNGACQIDCTQISVSNCATCKTTTSCSGCVSGYTLVSGGSLCQLTCTVTNCQLCTSSPSVCQVCNDGYSLATSGGVTTCNVAFCSVAYCSTCATVSTCSACVSGFSLTNSTTCSSNCPGAGVNNCLICSGSTCTVCMTNYILSSGSCVLPCASITNCVACISSALCASCASGYSLSSDYKTCSMVCVVQGCSVCPSSTSLTCTTCSSGYTSSSSTKCSKVCPQGTVNTGSTCVSCSTAISQCQTCSQLTNGTIICSVCLSGYFLNGHTCDSCSGAISNCLTCNSASKCTQCASTYNNINGFCDNGVCDNTVTNCIACLSTTTSVCAICSLNYQLVSNICTVVSCSNSYVFDEATRTCVCPTGTYDATSGGTATCLACADKCTNCTVSVCFNCVQGYYAVGTSCSACLPNCRNCNIGSSCQVCLTGYSLDSNGACISLGSGTSGTLAADGSTVVLCEAGCQACVSSSSSTTGTICTLPENGYSILGGVVLKCHPNCLTCASYLISVCTSCYLGSVLRSGTCVSCSDPNALTCSPLNVAYSLTCKVGYTGGASSTSVVTTGGTCQACSAYCRSCFANGPGQCDANGCIKGTVQLTGTTNCTKCFNGCITCSAADPNNCLDCGNNKYLTTSSICASCPTGCRTCTSASSCQSCTIGYFLVSSSCVALPAFCVSLDSSGNCNNCFGGYTLNTGSNTCSADLTCNSTSSCTVCPQGYTLSSGQCSACTLGTSCLACSSTSSTTCIKCATGSYLDASNVCQTCQTNCLACDSSSFCTTAASGYFVKLAADGSYSGVLAQCYSLCATCVDEAQYCLSCIAGYTLQGSACIQNFYLAVNMVLGSASTNTIFDNGTSVNQQLSDSIKAVNRICNHFLSILPAAFKRQSTDTCFDLFNMNALSVGSIILNMTVNAGQNTNSATATSSFNQAVASSSPDGFTILSSSVSSVGGNTSTSDGAANLGLILGLSIPLTILLVLIILIVAKLKCSDEDEQDYNRQAEKYKDDDKFYSEDRVDGQEARI